MALFEIHSIPVDEVDMMVWDDNHVPTRTERVGYMDAENYEKAVRMLYVALAQGTWLPRDAHILPQHSQT